MGVNRAAAEDYLSQAQALLPPGAVWVREPGFTLTALLWAIATEMARIHNRAADLVDEADPRTAVESLPDWERMLGLPDECSAGVATTLQERRAAVVAALTARGGQSRAYFIALAAALGFEITITEYRPFLAGASSTGDPCCSAEWRFVWRVNAPETTIRDFRAGASAAGEPLRKWGNTLLECAISKRKPAHTRVEFAYGS